MTVRVLGRICPHLLDFAQNGMGCVSARECSSGEGCRRRAGAGRAERRFLPCPGFAMVPLSTVAEPAGYGYRRQNRQDFSSLLGRLCRCGRLCGRGADGTRGDGDRWHEADPVRTKAALAGAALRKAIMAIWCLCFCGHCHANFGQWPLLKYCFLNFQNYGIILV